MGVTVGDLSPTSAKTTCGCLAAARSCRARQQGGWATAWQRRGWRSRGAAGTVPAGRGGAKPRRMLQQASLLLRFFPHVAASVDAFHRSTFFIVGNLLCSMHTWLATGLKLSSWRGGPPACAMGWRHAPCTDQRRPASWRCWRCCARPHCAACRSCLRCCGLHPLWRRVMVSMHLTVSNSFALYAGQNTSP